MQFASISQETVQRTHHLSANDHPPHGDAEMTIVHRAYTLRRSLSIVYHHRRRRRKSIQTSCVGGRHNMPRPLQVDL